MAKHPRIGTTSYAILGLLAAEPGTAYDLTQRMTRNYKYIWPRAQSKLFEEVKRLVSLKLASAHPGMTGKRRHTLYRITETGRRALAIWVGTPSELPTLEFEALLKVSYGDQAGRHALLDQLAAIQTHARSMRELGRTIGRSILAGEPWHRAGTQSLMWRFLWDHYGAMMRWAAWAQEEVEHWPTIGQPDTRRGIAILEDAIGAKKDRRRRRT